jgi:RNase H
MAVIHAKDHLTPQFTKCRIFSDSQPAMRSLAKPKRQSGQSIIKRILDDIDALYLTKPTYAMQIEWVPGHVGINGNKKADQAAKSAAIDEINPIPPIILKSARANEIHQSIEGEQQKQWVNGKGTALLLRNITKRNMMKRDPNQNTKRTRSSAEIYNRLRRRKHIAWVARLRTGHCSLNSYLERFNIIDDATCPGCGDTKETVHHFLMVCPKHERWRDKMRREVGVGGMKMEKLLGDSRRIRDTIEFIENTERFEF